MKVLLLTAHFRPNIGGVETHLDNLCESLVKRDYQVTVLTYRPLQTKAEWKILEREKNLEIIRLPWIPNFFYKLVNNPMLEFLYLVPGIFLVTPLILSFKKINVIHTHGLVAGFVGVFWGKIFGKRVVISLHSIYHFPKTGLYKYFVSWIFNNADYSLGLSKQSVEEIKDLGISANKVGQFTYWIDLNKFNLAKINKHNSKSKIKEQLEWKGKLVVLFVGRLVREKGVMELLEAAKVWHKSIDLIIIGSGPLEEIIKRHCRRSKNIIYLGKIEQDKLPLYYSGVDVLIVPSTSEEGFGRVILESLACGTPVIGAKRGAIPEAMNETVGRFIEVSTVNIKNEVEYLLVHQNELKKLATNCRKFTERRFSEKNVENIIRSYSR